MYGKTTILAVLPTLLCLITYPLQANQSLVLHRSGKGPAVEPLQGGFTEDGRDWESAYLLLRGRVSTEDCSSLPGGYFHLDVYQSSGVGEKKLLVRTGRYQGDSYEVYLSRGFDHTLVFKVENFPYYEIQISAEETRAPAKEVNLDVVLPATVADEPTSSEPTAEVVPEVKETALLPTPANRIKAISVDLTVTDVPVLPVKITAPPSPPEQQKQNRAPTITKVYSAQHNLIPLYEEFGGKGEVLTEITDWHLMEVLEKTTSQWWLVAYKSELGWVNAQQLKAVYLISENAE